MFYIAVVPVLALAIKNLHFLRKMRNHDVVLFRFCDIRRDLMSYLRNDFDSLTAQDYKEAKELLNLLHIYIHFYDECKRSLFDLWTLRIFLKQFRKKARQVRNIERFSNKQIETLRIEICKATLFAFFTHTPILKPEPIFKALLNFAAIIKWREAKNFLSWLEDFKLYAYRASPSTA